MLECNKTFFEFLKELSFTITAGFFLKQVNKQKYVI